MVDVSSSVRVETHDFDDELRRCIELAKNVDNNALLYIDYTAERYPYATATVIDPESGLPYLQITFRVDVRGRDAIISFRARCSHGWVFYGYGPITSRDGVVRAGKGWFHARGTYLRPINVVKDLEEQLFQITTYVVEVAQLRLVEEGYL